PVPAPIWHSGARALKNLRKPSGHGQKSSHSSPLVNSFPNPLNDFGRESLDVAWIAARDQALIDYHCLIDPIGPGILHVSGHGMVGGHLAALDQSRLDQSTRSGTTRRHRLPAIGEIPDEGNGILVGAQ